MKGWPWVFLLCWAGGQAAAAGEAPREEARLYNPYERRKNGPPLTKVFHKAKREWLLAKLEKPRRHPAARMPDFKFTETEALDILAYLKRIAGPPLPKIGWPAWADKSIEQLSDEQFEAVDKLATAGKGVWGNARCSICHSYRKGGVIQGGFVDLRTGGMALQFAGSKLKRDWIFQWIKDPKNYFPETLMPRFRLSDQQVRSLVEYLLRDEAFRPPAESKPHKTEWWKTLDEPERIERGKQLIRFSRCVVCHDIQGIPELFPKRKRGPLPPPGSFAALAHDLRCLTCHSINGRGGTYAPDLTHEGSRLRERWIAAFVQAPDMIRPLSQQMPKFFLSDREAKVAASYLARFRRSRTIPEEMPGGPVQAAEVQKGRKLFNARGCLACHSAGEAPGGSVGPDLSSVFDRLKPGYLWYYLKHPHEENPPSPAPDYGLSDEEARVLAAYLSTKKKKK